MKTSFRLALAATVAAASVPFASSPVSAAEYAQRLGNLSTRARVGTGANVMITGFVVQNQSGAPKRVLIRAVGARLAQTPFSVPGALMNPVLQLFNADGTLVLANDRWLAADATVMREVGAFALANNSEDAALVANLSPGSYTAQVSGANNSSGVAVLEIYDVSGSARLMNLSTRALVGDGANTFFSGLVVAPGGGARRVLVRAAGPALSDLGVTGAVSDPALAVLDSAQRQVANGANDNWDATPGANATLSAAFTQAGAFPFANGSRDAAVVLDLLPGNYTIQVNGVAGATGPALVEVYDLSPETLSTVSVTATVPTTDTTSSSPAVFTFTRVGSVSEPLTVHYSMTGTAVAGTDFEALPSQITLPAGAPSATVSLLPKKNPANTNNRTATLAITSNTAYGVGLNDRASATIFANSGSLYVSTLRALPNATASTAYGTATVQLAPDEAYAFVNIAFSNLSSPEVVAHLSIDGNYVFNLPQGQVVNAFWDFPPVGTYSRGDLIAALKAGRVTVSIDTANYPAGELGGGFVKSSGTAAFNPPPAAPALDLTRISAPDAARFLMQATFGATPVEMEALRVKGYNAWLAEQMALPASLHLPTAEADMAEFGFGVNQTINGVTTPNIRISSNNRQAAWWKIAVQGPDQLRQRTAFALSEILVISDANGTINAWQNGATNYYDLLVKGAFGNFRDLLEQVTLSPMMGIYLSSLRSAKAANNTTPDENYAREIMQLFTIGLHELNADGTLRLDPNGQPIPTYTQETIVQMAKVFTGWGYANRTANATANANLFRGTTANYIDPMMLWPAYHDDTAKTIVGGRVLPAAQGGVKDLQDTLDALFNHPNTGPFISRQLIQRLVTSNPSPAYVYRVAQVFANNGAGVRGDLGAVVRAILMDYEARSSAVAATATFGKLKEPLLRSTAILRAFDGASNLGRYGISTPERDLSQAALRSPTVFNFFEPNFVLPGAVASAGLYAPEYQILTDTTALTQPNFYYSQIFATRSTTDMRQTLIGLNLTPWLPMARNPQQLVDSVNLVLAASTVSKATTDRMVAAITAMPVSTGTNTNADLDRVRSAIYLAIASPHGAIQK